MQSKYGLSPASFDALLSKQGGCCAICLSAEPGGRHGQWHIDHDHQTGHVRGLLCQLCNVGLGHFRDRADLLYFARAYLRGSDGFDGPLAKYLAVSR